MKGLGDTAFATTDLSGGPSAQILFPYPTYEFEYTEEADSVEPEAYRAGKRVSEDAYENKVTYTLKLKTQIVNWQTLGLGRGLLERTITSMVMPKIKRATVPAGGVINDAALVTGNLGSVIASIERVGSWGQAGPLARGTTTPTARQVVVAAGSLTFNSAQIGAPIMYLYDETLASVKAYGGAGTQSRIGELQFVGEVYDNSATPEKGGRIWYPRLKRKTRPAYTFAGDIPELETEYSALIPSGWEEPYVQIDGHSITA